MRIQNQPGVLPLVPSRVAVAGRKTASLAAVHDTWIIHPFSLSSADCEARVVNTVWAFVDREPNLSGSHFCEIRRFSECVPGPVRPVAPILAGKPGAIRGVGSASTMSPSPVSPARIDGAHTLVHG